MALGVWGAGEWVLPQDLAFFRLLQVFRNPETRDGLQAYKKLLFLRFLPQFPLF